MNRFVLLLAVAATCGIAARIASSGEDRVPGGWRAEDLARADAEQMSRIAQEVHASGAQAVQDVLEALRLSSSRPLEMSDWIPFAQQSAPFERALATNPHSVVNIRYWAVQLPGALLRERQAQKPVPSPILAIDEARAMRILGGRDDRARSVACFVGQTARIVDVVEIPYVRDYDYDVGEESAPQLLGCVREGTVALLTPHMLDGEVELDVNVKWGVLRRPIPVFRAAAILTHPEVAIQLPELQLQTVEQRVAVPARGWLLVLPNSGFAGDEGWYERQPAVLLHISVQTLHHEEVPPMEEGVYVAPPPDSDDSGARPGGR